MINLFQQLENIPCFSKSDLRLVYSGSENGLNEQIKRAVKNKNIITLKKGLYTTYIYWLKEANKTNFLEFIASKIRQPSYLSLEYILAKNGLLTEAVYPITSITLKCGRSYQNSLGVFNYKNIKNELFFGFEKKQYGKNEYYCASLAKALFDWLYLKKNLNPDLKKVLLEELRINWDNFSSDDFYQFNKFAELSKSKKMAKIAKILRKEIYVH